jgi:hypothetical protein
VSVLALLKQISFDSLFLLLVRIFYFSEETVGKIAKIHDPSPSVSSASKQNPKMEPAKKIPTVEVPVKATAEMRVKRYTKDVLLPDLSLNKH